MRISAASCTAVHELVSGPRQPAAWLGASPSALYLLTRSSTVLAILTHDAVRLPCAVVVAHRAGERPLSMIAPDADERLDSTAWVGHGEISWHGMFGEVTIAAVRRWAPARVGRGVPAPDRSLAAGAMLAGIDIGLPVEPVDAVVRAGGHPAGGSTAVGALLGRGPGLTPSGDDVLAGFVLGCLAFGHLIPGVVAALAQLAPITTTALSAQLLAHALAGECVPEVADFVAALSGRGELRSALEHLLAVGNTSGAALATGVLAAARYPVVASDRGVLGASA
jgi:hypothetical protein